MKKIIASAGLVAVGASAVQAVNYGDIAPESANKRWSVSAAVRGFYDDNYTTRPSGPDKKSSFGVEVIPSFNLNLPMETSFVGLGYIYTMDFYEDRTDNKVDQSHDAKFTFDHRFSERSHLNFVNHFIYSFEPTVLSQGTATPVPLRAEANAIHNRAVASFDTLLNPVWSITTGYENNYWNYLDDGGPGSYSALLDRVEHLLRFDPTYQLSPNTKLFAGYQLGINDYLSSDLLAVGSDLQGTDRDSTSHYGYVGAKQQVSSALSLEGRVGIQYFNYTQLDEDSLSPYLDVFGSYAYLPGSSLRFGVRQAHNATDIGVSPTDLDAVTLDQETTTIYMAANHRITSDITGGATVQYQHSIYNGGDYDGEADNYVSVGASLAYKLDLHWSLEAIYSLDWLSSDIENRGFTRNRVTLGARGTF
jgi:hypothetical protein